LPPIFHPYQSKACWWCEFLNNKIPSLPKQSMLVVRVLKQQNDYTNEVAAAVEKVVSKLVSFNKKADA